MATRKQAPWLKCEKCGKVDKTDETVTPHHIGTRESMGCRHCSNGKVNAYGNPVASMCRDCCPTGHGTRFDTKEWE